METNFSILKNKKSPPPLIILILKLCRLTVNLWEWQYHSARTHACYACAATQNIFRQPIPENSRPVKIL